MKIYTVLGRGKYHPVYGEDFILYQRLNDAVFVAAVMDGCSSGKESFFASALYGKSIRKSLFTLRQACVSEKNGPKSIDVPSFILRQLFDDLQKSMKLLALGLDEVLSTLLLLVLDIKNKSASVTISGDGLIACNGEIYEIDQQNVPDYMAYHIGLGFEKWLKNHTKQFDFKKIRDISISTDGVSKIINIPPATEKKSNAIEQLLIKTPDDDEGVLQNRFDLWINSGEYIAYDDVGIIRTIL